MSNKDIKVNFFSNRGKDIYSNVVNCFAVCLHSQFQSQWLIPCFGVRVIRKCDTGG